MNKNFRYRNSDPRNNLSAILLCVFAASIVIACGLVFLFNYSVAFDDDPGAGFLPPSAVIIYYYFLISLFSIIVAVILKLALKSKVRLSALLLIAVLLPIFCYAINYNTLNKDGVFYPLVDEGGIFHFVTHR